MSQEPSPGRALLYICRSQELCAFHRAPLMDTALARLFLIDVAKPPSGGTTSWAWTIEPPSLAALIASPLCPRRYECRSGSPRKSLRHWRLAHASRETRTSASVSRPAPLQTQESHRNQIPSLSA